MSTPLTDVSGIGPSTAEILQAHGIESAEALATASISEITAVPGFSDFRATRVQEAAAALLDSRNAPKPAAAPARKPATAKPKPAAKPVAAKPKPAPKPAIGKAPTKAEIEPKPTADPETEQEWSIEPEPDELQKAIKKLAKKAQLAKTLASKPKKKKKKKDDTKGKKSKPKKKTSDKPKDKKGKTSKKSKKKKK